MKEKNNYVFNNLYFYKVIKQLIKFNLSTKNRQILQELIFDNLNVSSENLYKTLLISEKICKKSSKKYYQFQHLIELLNEIGIKMFIDYTFIALDLISLKDWIIDTSHLQARKLISHQLRNVDDKLSLLYDSLNINLPYGERVICALLTELLIKNIKDSELISIAAESLSKIPVDINEIIMKINDLKIRYGLNVNSIFNLIVSESINQKIIANAGVRYEQRVKNSIQEFSNKLIEHKHDSKHPEVEYDFIVYKENKIIGINCKRTLRERYKQNIYDCNFLDVDYLFVFTLGLDLTFQKINNILAKHNVYLVIAEEIYNSDIYYQNNPKIFSSVNLNNLFTLV
ncbi:hypothetical protein [Mycoplasma seminis]|uniref:Restriction endonuclease n=1 Tax=Mycoplasma seminis TaxID=512749 RepID=A0ABY9HDB2_9MOLU|nr:hypothetical protein [Mycoplasma seminis]WLP85668.1 hypothetical protein Q8852_00705 [Mycoplasma seminis]